MKNITGKKLCKILEENGWELVRISGSHHVFAKDGEEAKIVVPVHGNREIKTGLLKAILKTAGLLSIFFTLRQEGCRLHFYHINKNFMPLCEFNKNDFILYINYFGLCDENCKTLEKKYPNIIIDNTQSFYSKPSGLASFNSLRKFFKVQNGAYLYTKISINTNFQTDNLKLELTLRKIKF